MLAVSIFNIVANVANFANFAYELNLLTDNNFFRFHFFILFFARRFSALPARIISAAIPASRVQARAERSYGISGLDS